MEPHELTAAKQAVINAVLYRVYAEEAYGGRETAGASASLDYAYDELDEAFQDYYDTMDRHRASSKKGSS